MKGWLGLSNDESWILVVFCALASFLLSACGRALLAPPSDPVQTVWGLHMVWLSFGCGCVVVFCLVNLFQMHHGKGSSDG